MLYEFVHFDTPHGRRVGSVFPREDFERAVALVSADYFAGELKVARSDEEVSVLLTVPAAVKLRDAFGMVGGDAAVTARTFSDQLDDMVVEIQRARSTASTVTRHARRFLSAAAL